MHCVPSVGRRSEAWAWPPSPLRCSVPSGAAAAADGSEVTAPLLGASGAATAAATLTGESGIAGFYVPNPNILNIIMGPLPSGGDDSAEINGLLGDIASGAGEGHLWLPGALYLFGSPLILQSNVDIKAKSTFRPTSGLTTGAVIEAPESAGITDVILDGIRVDGGFWDYGTGLAGVLLSRATRVKFINGKIVNCGGLGRARPVDAARLRRLQVSHVRCQRGGPVGRPGKPRRQYFGIQPMRSGALKFPELHVLRSLGRVQRRQRNPPRALSRQVEQSQRDCKRHLERRGSRDTDQPHRPRISGPRNRCRRWPRGGYLHGP